jgi:hypothetical protein
MVMVLALKIVQPPATKIGAFPDRVCPDEFAGEAELKSRTTTNLQEKNPKSMKVMSTIQR